MKNIFTLITLTLFTFTGCTSPTALSTPSSTQTTVTQHSYATQQYEKQSPEKFAMYQQTMKNVAAGIKNDPTYQRIALNTPEKKAWFRTLTYRLWDRQITRQQFITEGLSKYPSRRYEFNFIINGFNSVCS